jgi:hypothetical protein
VLVEGDNRLMIETIKRARADRGGLSLGADDRLTARLEWKAPCSAFVAR